MYTVTCSKVYHEFAEAYECILPDPHPLRSSNFLEVAVSIILILLLGFTCLLGLIWHRYVRSATTLNTHQTEYEEIPFSTFT